MLSQVSLQACGWAHSVPAGAAGSAAPLWSWVQRGSAREAVLRSPPVEGAVALAWPARLDGP